MKKVRNFLKLFMWATIGGFIGRTIQTYVFYKKRSGILGLMSAPWYAELCVPLLITVIVVTVVIVVRIVLKRIDKE